MAPGSYRNFFSHATLCAFVALAILVVQQVSIAGRHTAVVHGILNDARLAGHQQNSLHINRAAFMLENSTETTTVNKANEASETSSIWNLPFPCPFPKNSTPPPTLQFLHIRKTGGTAIAQAFKKAGIKIERNYKWTKLDWTGTVARRPNTRHLPARNYVDLQSMPHDQNVTFFAVVRNPYERTISEYYQYFKSGRNRKPPGGVNNETSLNRFVVSRFANHDGDLFIPQIHYLYLMNGTRFVDHVLRFESLRQEFPALMECYGLADRVQLPANQVNPRQMTGSRLSVQNLSAASVRLINRYEALIFSDFNYTIILPDGDLLDEQSMLLSNNSVALQ